MVRYLYYNPREVKFFYLVDHLVDRRRKLTWWCNTKIDISIFLFVEISIIFFVNIRFWYWNIYNPPIVGKTEVARSTSKRAFAQSGYTLSTLLEWKMGLRESGFARQFRTPNGTTCRVPGVWEITLPTYFNFWYFFPKTHNCRSPSGDQLIFMSRNGNVLFATV